MQDVQAKHDQLNASVDDIKQQTLDKEDRAVAQREAAMQALKEKMRAKEEHARKVREAKRLSSGGVSAAPLATVNA